MLLGQILLDPMFEALFGLRINQLVTNLVLDRGQRLFAGLLMFLNLDDMEAVAGVNQRRNAARLGLFDRGGDLIVEVGGIEFTQVSAFGLGIVVRILPRQLAKI